MYHLAGFIKSGDSDDEDDEVSSVLNSSGVLPRVRIDIMSV